MEIGNLPDKEFRVMVIKIFTRLEGRRVNSGRNSTRRIYKKDQLELKNDTITRMKNRGYRRMDQ